MPRNLAERLRDRIRRDGPISFADFMEAALYDPDGGYYSRGAPIGEGGDFVTSPSVSPAFAATLARRFADDASVLEGPLDFVEVGAGDGRFLADFRAALESDYPAVAGRTRLTAVERGPAARKKLSALGLDVRPDARELPERSVNGWIFANELYDALPVARVRGTTGALEELRVATEGERFVWVAAPAPAAWMDHLLLSGTTFYLAWNYSVAAGTTTTNAQALAIDESLQKSVHNTAALADLQSWVASGKLKVQEDVIDGIENTPKALIGLLAGENRGKRMVKV